MSESVGVAGVVGDEDGVVAECLHGSDCEVRTLTPTAAVDTTADVLVVVGEQSLLDLVAAGIPDVPTLPIGAGDGVRSVPRDAADTALSRVVLGDASSAAYPVLGVRIDDEHRTQALFECMLVTAEPARISEYAVETGDVTVDQFRADGVVVATPAGTHGYARRVDAPVIDPSADVVAVDPVAPFATHSDHWVFPTDTVRITVARDEEPVELLADDRTVGPITPGTPVVVSRAGTLSIPTVPESDSPFPAHEQ